MVPAVPIMKYRYMSPLTKMPTKKSHELGY